MGFRTKGEVIYSRVDATTKREFDRQMSDSGYRTSSGFIAYLLRVNAGKQADGVTLREVREVRDALDGMVYELKKQGVNINQMARNINAFPEFACVTSFREYEHQYRKLENKLLEIYERLVA